jgi:hypothetical protein
VEVFKVAAKVEHSLEGSMAVADGLGDHLWLVQELVPGPGFRHRSHFATLASLE